MTPPVTTTNHPMTTHNEADVEGWDVFDCGTRSDGTAHVEIQRIDFPEDGDAIFPNDEAAWDFVVAQARHGSARHQRALGLIDPVERFLIEARCGTWAEDPANLTQTVGSEEAAS